MVSDKVNRSTNDVKEKIKTALQQFEGGGLFDSAISFFDALGYNTSLRNRLESPTLASLLDAYDLSINAEKVMSDNILTLELLFQLRKEEITNQVSLFDTRNVNNKLIESYLFFAIELTGTNYTRSQLAQITREFNRVFPMPVMLLFKYGNLLTLSAIDRRINKRNADRDVLERITLIKDINIDKINRAQLEILYDLSFDELYRQYKFTSFVELHDAWQKTLDISQLNKRFYDKLFTWYLWAKRNVRFPKPEDETLDDDAYRSISVIRLLTRLIFVWFVKEKGLVPDALFDERYLRTLLKNANGSAFNPDSLTDSNYYRAILQNLFFATLNTPMAGDAQTEDEQRQFIDLNRRFQGHSQQYTDQTKYRYAEYFIDPSRALAEFEQVPFLNGGLFECLDYPADSTTNTPERRYDGFSTTEAKRAFIPNALFFGEVKGLDLSADFDNDRKRKSVDVQGLIRILSAYKFTITENTPLEQEIALDPELLGKVFENLLASYNPETGSTARKQTGSFYTPREIVNYMVDESLKAYMRGHLPESNVDDRLNTLFSYTTDENPFSPDETTQLIKNLSVCKILDPACGSGAFPMGVLHRMVHLLGKLDPNNRQWKETLLSTAEEDLRKANELRDEVIREQAIAAAEQRITYIRDSFDQTDHEFDYTRKLFLIEECIYGVDKQQIAVQIAKLRFFISLIVEQRVDDSQPNRNVLSMPNLETKFVAADTLISLDKPKGQLTIGTDEVKKRRQELDEVRKRIFSIKRFSDKKKLRVLEAEKRRNLSTALIQSGFVEKAATQAADWNPFDMMHSSPFFDTELMFGEDLREGFNVVLGNPPYVSANNMSPKDRRIIVESDSYTTLKGKWDLYIPFIERSLNLLAIDGSFTFIVPFGLLNQPYAEELRKYILKDYKILSIVDLHSDRIFENATIPSCIPHIQKTKSQNHDISILEFDKTNFNETYKINIQKYHNTEQHMFRTEDLNNVTEVLSEIKRAGKPLEENFYVSTGAEIHGKEYKESDGSQTSGRSKFDVLSKNYQNGFKPYVEGSAIEKSKDGRYSHLKINQWLDYSNPSGMRSPKFVELFESQKIIIRGSSGLLRILATYDERQIYTSHKSLLIITKSNLPKQHGSYKLNDTLSLKYLLAILNSALIDFYYKSVYGGFIDVYPNNLKALPICEVSPSIQRQFIIIVDYILTCKKEAERSYSDFFERVVDAMVYELYFPEQLRAANCNVLKYLEGLPDMTDLNQIKIVYEQLSDPLHPVSTALFKMDSIEEIRIIEGKA